MPIFDTPAPIDLAINLPVGVIRVVASDRDNTVVTVEPTDPTKASDLRGAEETSVVFDGHRLTVKAPKPRFSVIGPTESIDLRVELPTGSRLTAEISVGNVRTSGRLGATRIKALTGSVEIEATDDLWLRAGHGSTVVGTINGSAEITSDHGQLRVGTVSRDAVLSAAHGSIYVEESGGDVQAKLSYGDLEITRALASVSGKTAYGSVTLHEVSAGSIEVESSFGGMTVGVRRGVAAWLDLSTKSGRVRNELEGDGAPQPSDDTVAVRARTQFGDITIQHNR